MPMPELGPIEVGRELNAHIRTMKQTVRVKVVKIARVWADLEPVDEPPDRKPYRLRLGTTKGHSPYNYETYYRSDEQEAWLGREAAARDVLHAAKMYPEIGSLWGSDERLFALADFITTYDAEHPKE
jgi:hypothetical protein